MYLSEASLCGSNFNRCEFSDNIFRKGKADDTRFSSTVFKNLDSFRTTFYESKFFDVEISNAQLELTYMDDSTFSEVEFKNTRFSSSTFNNSTFKNVKFLNCHFENTKFLNITGFDEIHFVNSSITIHGELLVGISSHEMKSLLDFSNTGKPNKELD